MKQIAEGPYPENVIKLGVLDHCESLVLEADGKRGEIEELFRNVRSERTTKIKQKRMSNARIKRKQPWSLDQRL